MMEVFVANTNVITLYRLTGKVDHAYIENAAVSVTIVKASDRTEVAGQTWPMTMDAVDESPSRGDFRAVLSHQIAFEAGTNYIAIVDAHAGEGRTGHWEIPLVARTRR
jgi:hypothetical protein